MLKMPHSYAEHSNHIGTMPVNTALHNACRTGRARSITALVEAGAFVDIQRPTTGETPLHEALRHGFPECAELLINAGANKNVVAFDGKRPAEVAVEVLGANAPILAKLI
jgi:ankyrin repeat protein